MASINPVSGADTCNLKRDVVYDLEVVDAFIDRNEAQHIGRVIGLEPDARGVYRKEIRARVDAIREKVLAARHDPHRAHEMISIARDGMAELDRSVEAFWEGREAAEKVGLSVSAQFAAINAAVGASLTRPHSPGDEILFKGALAVGGGGLGFLAGSASYWLNPVADMLMDSKTLTKAFVGTALGAGFGWVIGAALLTKEAQ